MLIFKNSLRKIKKSIGRFLSLIFIVMLGSAFFSGVRESSMDMIKTIDEYYDETNLMDYKIISSLGLTEGDLKSIKNISDDLIVEPSYSFDILLNGDATRVHALSNINKVNLVSGKLPNKNECLVEEGTYKIGDKIKIDSDNLKVKEYTVSGTITSSLYIYKIKGISNVGDGKLDKFIYIPKENFNLDYYTEIYILDKNAVNKTSYLKDYKNEINILNNKLKKLKPIRETIRYEEILKEATDKINDAYNKLEQEKNKNGKKLSDAKKELDLNKKKLNDARIKLEDGRTKLNDTKLKMDKLFKDSKNKLEIGKKQYKDSLVKNNIKEEEIQTNLNEINKQIDEINKTLDLLDKNSLDYIKYSKILEELNKNKINLEQLINIKNDLLKSENDLNYNIKMFNKEYNKNKREIDDNQILINTNQKKLNEGYKEYNENYNKYKEEINKGLEKINKAKADLNKIEKPKWYLLSREDNTGYTNFYESAIKIDSIAKVFPLFFMVVVFLMSLNTMTRMIEEERGEIGIYVSLGISKIKIVFSYLFYVLCATILGLTIGLAIGYNFVPHVLYSIYHANFILPKLNTYVEILPLLLIVLTTLGLMILVTLITVLKDFKYVPATLLRPIPPKSGKKVLLERIKFIWNKLSFIWKVTIRNLFRYKKRIIMTVLGISGCTALLLTGFGIKDSVKSLVNIQYNQIHLYDSMLILKKEIPSMDLELNEILNNKNINDLLYTHMETFDYQTSNKKINTYLLGFENKEIVNKYFNLTDLNGNKLNVDDNGVIITEKMAKLLDIKEGQTISIRNSDNDLFILSVNGICKNYVNSYVYLSSKYYEEIFGKIKYNTIITNVKKDQALELMETDYFNNIQYTDDTLTMFTDIIKGMNNIVILIILASSLLAIIVLYNLTTININERKREIATLKVLGFKDNEVSSYVYRETLILTIVGIILGLFLGITLNNFVLQVAETDEILFVKDISTLSYIYSFLIMIIFTVIVQVATYFILKKIDMIESLKSVE